MTMTNYPQAFPEPDEIDAKMASSVVVKDLGAYGTWSELELSNKVRLFQACHELAHETVSSYQGDFYHDALFISSEINGPCTFYWSYDDCGTYVSMGPEIGTYRKHAYEVVITCIPWRADPADSQSGKWVATFTPVSSTGDRS